MPTRKHRWLIAEDCQEFPVIQNKHFPRYPGRGFDPTSGCDIFVSFAVASCNLLARATWPAWSRRRAQKNVYLRPIPCWRRSERCTLKEKIKVKYLIGPWIELPTLISKETRETYHNVRNETCGRQSSQRWRKQEWLARKPSEASEAHEKPGNTDGTKINEKSTNSYVLIVHKHWKGNISTSYNGW